MTADMAFECLLVSRDPNIVSVLNGLLKDLSISTEVCQSLTKAADHLLEGSTDLVIIDWEKNSATLLDRLNKSRRSQKPAVIVVSETESTMSGTYSLSKPVTTESGGKALKLAYSRMLDDHRQHTRYALMTSVTALHKDGRLIPATVTNIGEGGVGLNTKESVVTGDVLHFLLLLPGTTTPIQIQSRVKWKRRYGVIGCEFAYISMADKNVLAHWLDGKSRVKQPLVCLTK